MKRTPLHRKTPLRRSSTPARGKSQLKPKGRLRARSLSKREADAKYAKAREEWFIEHPRCQMPGCRATDRDLHHKAGRRGPLLWCKKYFATLCRDHHENVHKHPSWSRENGWIVDVSSDEVQRLKLEEINVP